MESTSSCTTSDGHKFGQRYLKDESVVFAHNAWDDVEWTAEEEARVKTVVESHKSAAADGDCALRRALLDEMHEKWNAFYATHTDRFFMDRKWVARELPELVKRVAKEDHINILDVGCGVGNTTFPILEVFAENENVFVHSCDFSLKAIETMRGSEHFDSQKCRAFVWDLTAEALPQLDNDRDPTLSGVDNLSLSDSKRSTTLSSNADDGRSLAGKMDFILCIYVLSAIPPERHQRAVANLSTLLAPGGLLFIKDYARYDLTQLRFKPHRYLAENLYSRGDGTLVYYFESTEMDNLMFGVGLQQRQNHIDKRLIVNRAKQQKMYRRWIQCKYAKPGAFVYQKEEECALNPLSQC